MAIEINGTTGISGVDGSATTPAVQGSDSNTGISFGTDEVAINTGGTERVKVDSSGRLLVGTSTSIGDANARLQIAGVSGAAPSVVLARPDTSVSANQVIGNIIGYGNDSNGTYQPVGEIAIKADLDHGDDDKPGRITFSTTADGASALTERVRIKNNGYVQFKGNASGYHPFGGHQFVANTSDTMMVIENEATSITAARGGVHIIYTGAAPNNANANFLQADDTSAKRFEVRSNGGIGNFSSNNANLCDEREKKNIESLSSTWECLKNWELKKFHYNDDADTDDKRYGVIAQQVALHCPEVITDWVKQDAANAVLDDDGNVITPAREEIVRMGVKEQQMMWMAVKGLQEAIAKIETLEAKVAVLEAAS